MRSALRSFIGIIVFVAALGHVESREAGAFSNNDVRGNYGFVFDGIVLNHNDGTSLPLAAVGQFTADGDGHVSRLVRTLNVGGEIHQAVARGSYHVNPDGTGTAEFHVRTMASDGSVRSQGIERFRFVLARNAKIIHFIGLEVRGPSDEDIGIGIVLRGEAQRQQKGRR